MPHSHYCEKARWALQAAGVRFNEEPHLPLIHRLHTQRHGGGSVPLLVTGEGTVASSAEIVRFAEANAPNSGSTQITVAACKEALQWESYFDQELGPHTRRWAYFHLLKSRRLLNRIASHGTPAVEQILTPVIMGVANPLIARGLQIDATTAAQSLLAVHRVFNLVAQRLGQRGPFLLCDRFSTADLTFAALSAPVLLPAGFGGAIPALPEVPVGMSTVTERLRLTHGGRFALRLYAEYRTRPLPHSLT